MLKMDGILNQVGIGPLGFSTTEVEFGRSAFYFAEGKATNIEVVHGVDTSTLIGETFDLKKQGVYTLLVAGRMPDIETVFIEETNYPFLQLDKPAAPQDSIINIRFVNLSQDTEPLDIRLQSSITNEVSGLGYREYSPFKSFPAKIAAYAGTTGYSILRFEIVENGVVLTSSNVFVIPTNRFKNLALVVTGSKADFSLSVSQAPYY